MHITAAYSVFHRLVFSSSLKSLNNRQIIIIIIRAFVRRTMSASELNLRRRGAEYSAQPWPNFSGERRPNKLHKQIGIQLFVLHRGNKMLDFHELLTL